MRQFFTSRVIALGINHCEKFPVSSMQFPFILLFHENLLMKTAVINNTVLTWKKDELE